MKFMNMVIDETLRMYPITPRIDRVARNEYTYENIKMNKGDACTVAVWSLHYDQDIYPEPQIFNPYRFTEEAKKTRDSCAYLPFGAGPRNCIGNTREFFLLKTPILFVKLKKGMRFAIIEIKLLLASFLSKYKFSTSPETQVSFLG